MNQNYTHITLVVDRSGSMTGLRDDAQGGINTLLNDQFDLEGKLTVTLVEFDDKIDTVQRLTGEKFQYILSPRGSTALFDAVGREISQTGNDLASLPESERPAKVLFVVVTDGQENASSEYTAESIKDMVQHQEDAYNWQFQFIGADQSAWQGQSLGMSTYSYANTSAGTQDMYSTLTTSTTMYRSAANTTFTMADSDA